jgi:hypothetical protein
MPIQPNYNPKDPFGRKGRFNEDGSFTYPDGTVASLAEVNAERASRGMAPIDPAQRGTNRPWSTIGVTDPFGDVNAEQPMFGAESPIISPTAPGATLDVSKSNAERERLAQLLGSLQQQAATGGGAWEGQLKAATDKARSSAMALGQSIPGAGYSSSLRNIGNAQGAVDQRAVGQGNILREKSKVDATRQLAALLGAQGAQDLSQATAESDVAGGLRGQQANAAIQSKKNQADLATRRRNAEEAAWKGAGNAVTLGAAHLSDGGEVPGRARVFGNDEANDVVPAKLSPGEIVIPRSHASSPEAAAEFVRALQRNQPPQHFAGGGAVGPYKAPSIETGGLLNTEPFDANRRSSAALLAQLSQRAGTGGPSVAPQEMQDATDANIAAAMQASQNRRGAGAAAITGATGAAIQGAAGASAAQVAGEQSAAQEALAKMSLGQRDRELAMARAQQAAAWRDTLLNSGLTLEEAAMQQKAAAENAERTQRYLSGAGQGLAAWASAAGKAGSDSNDYAGRGSPSDLGRDKFAHGGEIEDPRAAEFVAALKRRRAA